MQRMTCLDGLRGVLAVYVMLSHMAPFALLPAWVAAPLSHGGAAVDVFFILSGLVIARSLRRFAYQPGPFLAARAARIFPVFLVSFAIAVAVQPLPTGFAAMPWIGADSPARAIWSQGWPAHAGVEIAAHLTMTHGLFPHGVLPDVWVSFLGAAWSLSTEWQFYMLALALGHRGRTAAWPFLALAAAGLAWEAATPEPWHFSRAFLLNKAGYFALGMASATLGRRYWGTLLAVLLLVGWQGGAAKLLAPLVWTLCLGAEFGWPIPGLAALLRARPLQWLGAVSYSLYLVNEPIQKLLGVALTALAGGDAVWFTVLWLPGAMGLPILAAALSRRWIEVPALEWARGRGG